MRKKTVFFNVMAVALASALGMAGCTTAPSSDTGAYASSSEAKLREHKRKQRLRAEEGGYKRLYRPHDCRQGAKGACSGFPTYNPS